MTLELPLTHVGLPCEDVEAARSFYTGILGFQVERVHEDWLELRAGDTLIALRPRWPMDGRDKGDAAGVHLCFHVPSIDALEAAHQELAAKGVLIADPPRDQPWNERTFFFKDPEGNLLEIWTEL